MFLKLKMRWFVILVTVLRTLVNGEFYDSFSGKEINKTRFDALNLLQLVPYCAIEVAPCSAAEPRRTDGSCNNLHYPTRGARMTPYRRLLPPTFSAGGNLRTSASGKPLPLARPLRVALMSDGRVDDERYTQMVANYNVFITNDITALHDTVNYVMLTRTCCEPGGDQDPRCIPIEVKDDDLHLRRSNVRCLNLTRAITYQRLGCIPDTIRRERINTVEPMLELSSLYGQDAANARRGRELRGGRLRAEYLKGKEWPPSGGLVCLNNEPPLETRCHDGPSASMNGLLGINILSLWFYRSHNAISRTLQELNPCWDDDKLYYAAREINIAYYVHITYYEMMTELIGWDFLLENKVVFPTLGHVNDYDPSLAPGVSIEYVTGTRWFHTLQPGTANLYTKDGRKYDEVAVVDFILRTGALPLNNTIEGMTQGCFRQPGGALDSLVDPDIGERILGRLQFASDVLASDIMKGRDIGLPPYNAYRKLCGLPEAKSFKDLLGWMGKSQVEAMASYYEHPDDIDLVAAILAESPMAGASMGPTLLCIMTEQLKYWRRADRFWYENTAHPGAFTEEQLIEIKKITLAKLICLHGDGVDAVQPAAFIVPGPGNEITKCSKFEMPNLSVFRDDRCYPKTTPYMEYGHPSIEGYTQNDYAKNEEYSYNNNQEYTPSKLTNEEYPYINRNYNQRDAIPRNPVLSANHEYSYSDPSLSTNQGYSFIPKIPIQHLYNKPIISYSPNVDFTNANPFQTFLKALRK